MEILENRKEFLDDFIRLNEEWISTYFEIEDVDRELASDPGQIIEKGGFVFSLVEKGEVAGVCALFNEGGGVFELARMAVSPGFHGNGYGNRLMEVCLDKLKAIGAQQVFLVSNTKLGAAIKLYRKYGFEVVSVGQHPVYARANIEMARSV